MADDAVSADPVPVQVGMVAPAAMNVPLWAAADAGEFTRRGIAIETRIIGSTEGTTDALLAGDIDVAFGSPDPALTEPHRVVILAGIADRPPLSLVCRQGLNSFEDLRGKSFGTTSLREGTVQLIQAMLEEHGLHYPGDYNLVIAGAHPQRWQALQDATIDAAMQLMPFDFIAIDAGYPVLGRAEDVVPHFAFSSVCVRTDWPDALACAFRDALLAGEQVVRSDRPRAAELIAQHAHLTLDHAKRCVDRLVDDEVMPTGLVHSAGALERTRQAIADGAETAKSADALALREH
jgi:ABC-type nitrate/sulfonate/bicarbonate transport system substrate-binding protein